MAPVNRLKDIGFEKVGTWKLDKKVPKPNIDSGADSSHVLYAFISGGKILYVGKTTQTLKRRMYGYQNPGSTQYTNIKVNGELKKLLKKGTSVDIFMLIDDGRLKYREYQVNLAAGLEDTLIDNIQPPWNRIGTRSS